MQKSFVLLFALLVSGQFSPPSFGQSLTYKNFTVENGLPTNEVYHIFQDSTGFLWFATDNGVARYDGFDFKTFNIADGLPDPVVFETLIDKSGKIWFRTFSGKIGYVENEKVIPYKFNNQLTRACGDAFPTSIMFDSLDQLWFTTGPKWGRVNSSGETMLRDVPVNSHFFKTIGQEGIYTGNRTRSGINYITINDVDYPIQLTDPFNDPKTAHPISNYIKWRENLYLTVNNNIFKYDGITLTRVYRGPAPIISLSTDRNNNLWIGFLSGGVKRFSNDDFKDSWSPDFISKYTVTKVLEDNEGGFWISTLENGIFYLPNPAITHHSLNSDSKTKTVLSTNSKVFIGEYDGTLTIIDSKSKEVSRRKFGNTILLLYQDKLGNICLSSGGTFFIIGEHGEEIRQIPYTSFLGIAETPGTIWALSPRWITRFDQHYEMVYAKELFQYLRNITTIDSTLIIGLRTGLNLYDSELNFIKSPTQLENFKVSEVKQLNDSLVFVATIGNGFVITDKNFNKFIHYKLPASNIYDVLQVDSSIWISTEKGIIKTTILPLLSRQASFEFITKRSGLLNNQVLNLVKVDNSIFAFYNTDFSVIPLGSSGDINQFPTFYVRELKVNSQNRDYSKELELPYDQNNIQLNFGFIAFNHQDIKIRYRLSDTDPWTYLGERIISLYSLSPGDYSLDIQYTIDEIHWRRTSTILSIHITPPWWQTLWFQVASIIGIGGLIYLFFNNRLVIYRQRVEKMKLVSQQQRQLIRTEIETLEQERSRIAKDLHDGVGTNILATKLNVGRLLKKHQEQERDMVEEQFQDTMREIKDIIYNLSPPGLERYGFATALKNYIERISVSTDINITLNSFGDELVDTNLSVPLFRILQELITNSLKHSKAKSISIHLNSFDDLYNIVYEDSGIGFSRDDHNNNRGLGLHSIESRVKAIHGKIRFESGSFGVTYSIDVPIKKKNVQN